MRYLAQFVFMTVILSLTFMSEAEANCGSAIQIAEKTCQKLTKSADSMGDPSGLAGSAPVIEGQCKQNAQILDPLIKSCEKALEQCRNSCQNELAGQHYCGQESGLYKRQYLTPGQQTLASMRACAPNGRDLGKDTGNGGKGGDEGQQKQANGPKPEVPKPPQAGGGNKPPTGEPGKRPPCGGDDSQELVARPDGQKVCRTKRKSGDDSQADRYNVNPLPGSQGAAIGQEPEVGQWTVGKLGDFAESIVTDQQGQVYAGGGAYQYGAGKNRGRRDPAGIGAIAAISPEAIEAAGGGWQQVEDGEAGAYVDGSGKDKVTSKKPERYGAKVFVNGEWVNPEEVSGALNDSQINFLKNQNLLSNLSARLNSQISRGDVCGGTYKQIQELKGSDDPDESILGFSLEKKIFKKVIKEGFSGDAQGLSMRCNMFNG